MMFFVGAILTICVQAFYDFVIRGDGVFDPVGERRFLVDVRPRVCYLVTGWLLGRWRRVWWVFWWGVRMRPEDLRPGRGVITVLAVGVGLIWFDWRMEFRYYGFLRRAYSNVKRKVTAISQSFLRICCGGLQLLPFPIKKSAEQYRHRHEPSLQPGEIRLLRLKHWVPFLGVRGVLCPAKIGDKPLYEAISYTWGTSKDQREVTINGKRFTTSISTYDALYGRSSMFRSRVVWIDYICIDQSNDIEKGSQVKMMTNIYENATRVVVWLGKPLSARLAISVLNEMANLPSNVDSYRRYEHLTSSVQWIAMADFFNLLWFTRVWIVQEVTVAKEVLFICGGMAFTWDMLRNWVEIFRDPQMSGLLGLTKNSQKAKRNISNFNSIVTAQRRFRITAPYRKSLETFRTADAIMKALNRSDPSLGSKAGEPSMMDNITAVLMPLSLPFLLTDFGDFDSTDPRDKIFAFAGLATDEANPAFAPDYSKPVEDVYRDTAMYLLRNKDPFCVISCAGIGSKRNLKLPSWVPDWTSPPTGAPFTHPSYFDDFSPDMRASACGKTKASVHFDNKTPDILGLDGIVVDEIAFAGKPFDYSAEDGEGFVVDEVGNKFWPSEFIDNYIWYEEAHNLAQNHASKYGTDYAAIEDAFWRTLIGDQTPFKRPAPDILYKDYTQWVELSKYNDKIAKEILAKERKSLPTDEGYWQTVQDTATWGTALGTCASMRKFAVTKGGYMAVLPTMAEVGDVVSVVCGCRYPLLLRRKGGSRGYDGEPCPAYELVGECYVHGIMDGEMMNAETSVERLLIV
ncbi:heterokaryon incompatibility protein-domain-containing protein [Cadophora sp. MPI-SDFR-AT-0126]|nr:heterokaryon incompatibility protein-domain-containing protein [Leotiomycetes sp. MPI-SDFR-AT-0126]